MRIGFIGAGVMGKTMGSLLGACGYEIAGYFSRSETSAYRATKEVGGKFYSDAAKLAASCDVLFITTPDDAVKEVVLGLGKRKCLGPGQVVVHMSGAHNSKILQPAADCGAYVMSMHPLQSCASVEDALVNLPLCVFSLEGHPEAVKIGKIMVSRIGAEFFVLNAEDKVLYHAAACVASNYLVTLFDAALELLDLSGVEKDCLVPALLPLIEGTLGNLRVMKPAGALTGPISRGDIGTVARHIKSLEKNVPDLLDLYKALGRRTLKIAWEKGKLNKDQLEELKSLLS
jgi:predicted short-subunit dehydrogenase-like oxidoreductase (DUF2520 family)